MNFRSWHSSEPLAAADDATGVKNFSFLMRSVQKFAENN
jgi:hypothetical protein